MSCLCDFKFVFQFEFVKTHEVILHRLLELNSLEFFRKIQGQTMRTNQNQYVLGDEEHHMVKTITPIMTLNK